MGPRTRTRARSTHDSYSYAVDKAKEDERALGFEKATEYEEDDVQGRSIMERQKETPAYHNNMIKSYAKARLLLNIKIFMTAVVIGVLPYASYLCLTYSYLIPRYHGASGLKDSIFTIDGSLLPQWNVKADRHFCDGLPDSTQCHESFRDHNLTAAFIIFCIGLLYSLVGFLLVRKFRHRYIALQVILDGYMSHSNTGLQLEAQRKGSAEENNHAGHADAVSI
ncbi:hypothetical protein DSL72_008497 [Monilinia vaccinii-corymbosi]|uniref:Uncharacterized protein n=1 Tax=Monilinia vaccinii-corymbosi TaxID=61207 RepID=A0A8A3PJR0_9HELO|nr:hypothetical protein DSL72_008497 [Monilinia vaccinii-corymbosi]